MPANILGPLCVPHSLTGGAFVVHIRWMRWLDELRAPIGLVGSARGCEDWYLGARASPGGSLLGRVEVREPRERGGVAHEVHDRGSGSRLGGAASDMWRVRCQ